MAKNFLKLTMFSSCAGCKFSKENEIQRLSDLDLAEEGEIFFIAGNDIFRRKIMELGFTKKTRIKVLKKSPFNDPISVLVREYEMIIKKEEADLILVSKVKNEKSI